MLDKPTTARETNWWSIYNGGLKRGLHPQRASDLADEWARRNGRENENPVAPLPAPLPCEIREEKNEIRP